MRNILLASLICLATAAISCKKSTFDPGATASVSAAGGWWVTFTKGGDDIYGLGTFFLTTYNTANNGDSIWVDNLENAGPFSFKVMTQVDYKTLSFSVSGSPNLYINNTVNILNGQILLNAGHSLGGNVVDSIYMQTQFSNDSTNATYVISGTRRTGFIEDDYQ
jgi:hypothetical protein